MITQLEKQATKLKEKAEAVLSQKRLTNTSKRIEEARHIEERARKDADRADLALRLCAETDLPASLRAIKTVQQLEALDVAFARSRDIAGVQLGQSYPYDRVTDEEALECAGERAVARMQPDRAKRLLPLLQGHTLREVLTALLEFKAPKRAPDPVKELERKLVGARIPGFFPTPRPLAARMVELAGVRRGTFMVEPSAGSGWIAEAARDAGCDDLLCIEINHTLVELLKAKGFTVEQADFLEHPIEPKADSICMNPPFENGQDMAHVRHAYDQLRVGGVLVAILSPAFQFHNSGRAHDFRGWLAGVDCDINEELPSGTFNHSDITQRTGVSARLVRIWRLA